MSEVEIATINKPKQYKRTGECLRCGQCCLTARLRLSKEQLVEKDTTILMDVLRWLSLRPKVFVKEDDVSIEIGVDVPCKFLGFDKKDEKAVCLIQDNKPGICRDFPKSPNQVCKGFKFEEIQQ